MSSNRSSSVDSWETDYDEPAERAITNATNVTSQPTDSRETESDDHVEKRKMDVVDGANPPTLQELATQKALSVILQPDFQDSDFDPLEPRLQRLLFSRVRSELLRLQKSTSFRDESTQRADAYLHTPLAKKKILAPSKNVYIERGYDPFEDMKASGEFEGQTEADWYEQSENPQNGFRLRDYYGMMWNYLDDDELSEYDIDETLETDPINWDSFYDVELSDSKLILSDPETMSFIRGTDLRESVRMRGKIELASCVSSQLLLYRLVTVLGIPPLRKTGYIEYCWEVFLLHHSGKGRFHLYDEHGAAKCGFLGNEEASKDALALLNYLCGTNIPHPDATLGVLAGVTATGDHYVMA